MANIDMDKMNKNKTNTVNCQGENNEQNTVNCQGENNEQNTSKLKQIIKKPIVKKISVCALVGVCSVGSYFIGKNVGLNSPATSKHYLSLNNKIVK